MRITVAGFAASGFVLPTADDPILRVALLLVDDASKRFRYFCPEIQHNDTGFRRVVRPVFSEIDTLPMDAIVSGVPGMLIPRGKRWITAKVDLNGNTHSALTLRVGKAEEQIFWIWTYAGRAQLIQHHPLQPRLPDGAIWGSYLLTRKEEEKGLFETHLQPLVPGLAWVEIKRRRE